MGQYYKTVNATKNEVLDDKFNGKNNYKKLTETAFIQNEDQGGRLIGLLLDDKSVAVLPEQFAKFTAENFPWGAWSGDVVVRAGDYDEDTSLIKKEYLRKRINKGNTEKYSLRYLLGSQNTAASFYFNNEVTLQDFYITFKQAEEYLKLFHSNDETIWNQYKQIKQNILNYNLYNTSDVFNKLSFNFSKSITNEKLFLINHTKKQYVNIKTYINQPAIDDDGYIIHPLPLLIAKTNGSGGGDYRGCNQYFVGYWAGDNISCSFFEPTSYKEVLPYFTEKYSLLDYLKNNMCCTELELYSGSERIEDGINSEQPFGIKYAKKLNEFVALKE